jgi:nucleoid DNA-binding protein
MESKPKNLGRAYLVSKLSELGLSRRDAVRILNFVLYEIAQALRRREPVEFPFGSLLRARHFHGKTRGRFLGKTRTIYRRRYTIRHELDDGCYNLLNGKKEEQTAGSGRGTQVGGLLGSPTP